MVRVFYALGDGGTPFRISIINIFLNAVLDFLLVNAFAAPGLVMATIGVNIISMVIFLWLLDRRLNGLPLLQWSKSLLGLLVATVLASAASYGISYGWENYLGNGNLILLLLQLIVASLVAVTVFFIAIIPLRLPEVAMLTGKIRQRLGR